MGAGIRIGEFGGRRVRRSPRPFGESWNAFWFEPCRSARFGAFRVVVGLLAAVYCGLWLADVATYFGPNGLTSRELVQRMLASDGADSYRVSPLFLSSHPIWLRVWAVIGIIGASLLAIGWKPRIAACVAWVAVTGFIQRAPALCGPFEFLLAPMLMYLALAKTNQAFALGGDDRPATSTRLGLRCAQVHFAIAYLSFALAKITALPWLEGDAVWWLAVTPGRALADLQWLRQAPWLMNAWTHAIVAFELAFPILVWRRSVRPWLLVLGCIHWLSFAVLSGDVLYCLLMAGGMWIYGCESDENSGRDVAA